MIKSYFISNAHALISILLTSLFLFGSNVTVKLLYIHKLTGYRATKQNQAKIEGLLTGYERATIKVAHFEKQGENQSSPLNKISLKWVTEGQKENQTTM